MSAHRHTIYTLFDALLLSPPSSFHLSTTTERNKLKKKHQKKRIQQQQLEKLDTKFNTKINIQRAGDKADGNKTKEEEEIANSQ